MSVRWLDISGNRRRGTAADSAEPCELSLASGEARRLLGAIGKEYHTVCTKFFIYESRGVLF